MTAICDRPGCGQPTVEDFRYCSEACFDIDQAVGWPPVTLVARGKAGGLGVGLHRSERRPVHFPDVS